MTRKEAVETLKGGAWICCAEKWNEALNMAIKVLEEQESCGDVISRQAVDDAIDKILSVKPQESKIGHWIEDKNETRRWDRVRFYCSECGKWQTYGKTQFCPKCGARMCVQQESEKKEI